LKVPGYERDLLSQPMGFDLEVYRKHFAPYPWTHVRGFRELFPLLLLQPLFDCDETSIEYLKGLWPQVMQRIPRDWSEFKFKNAHWSVCHGKQIARICAGQPARLDRGCHATIALQIAFERALNKVVREISVFEYLELVPAVFALGNLSDVAKAWLKGTVRPDHLEYDTGLFENLMKDLCPEGYNDAQLDRRRKLRTFLSNVADGHALTFENAQLIKSHFPPGWGSPQIISLQSRKDGKRRENALKSEVKLRCCDFESEFIRVGPKRLEELRERSEAARTHVGR
jgi:hypothetical protein